MLIFILFSTLVNAFGSSKCDKFTNVIDQQLPVYDSTIDEAYDCLESFELTEETKKELMETISYAMGAYVYKDILKCPPQPYENEIYHPTFDIDKFLDQMDKTNYTNFFDFYKDVQQMIINTQDSHLSFLLNGKTENEVQNLNYFLYYLPFSFLIESESVYLFPLINLQNFGVEIPEEVFKYYSRPVESINGEDPIEFMQKFSDEYMALHSPHARFTSGRKQIYIGGISGIPLSREYLNQNIVVKYDSIDETVTYNYRMLFINSKLMSKNAQRKLKQHLQHPRTTFLTLEDIVETEEMFKRKQLLKKQTNGRLFEEGDNIYCYVNDTLEVNTLVITTFLPDDANKQQFLETAGNCAEAFDKNKYPIQIILSKNGGGYIFLRQVIEKLFAHQDHATQIGAMRISEFSADIAKKGYAFSLTDIETCKAVIEENDVKLKEWFTRPNEIKYGNNSHYLTQLTFMPADYTIPEIFENYKRKPTEIVIYTDSYCFSSCSDFTKGFKEHGSAIIAGYDGNPKMEGTKYFDVGQSPTSVIYANDYLDKSNIFDKIGITMGISVYESFRHNYHYNETIPREYLVDEIDLRTPLNSYDEESIELFAAYTKVIVELFKEECNPSNKRLLNVDSACDEIVKKIDEHAHGGYLCGSTGVWSKECVIAYCDEGYVFDYANNKCLADVCYETSNEENKPSNTPLIVGIVFGVVALIIVIIVVIIIVVCICKKKKKQQDVNYIALQQEVVFEDMEIQDY